MKQVEMFHSEIPNKKQEEIARDLMDSNGEVNIVIATSALSMGFDAVGMFSFLMQFICFSKLNHYSL